MELFEAIKNDNVEVFTNCVRDGRGVLSLKFGRFPLLSLLYLYGASKIAQQYAGRLYAVTDYIEAVEPVEAYNKFRALCGRALRLFTHTVTPVEMLAVLGERLEVKRHFSISRGDDGERIAGIFELVHNVAVPLKDGVPAFKKLPLKRHQKTVLLIAAAMTLLVIIMSASAGAVVLSIGGAGSAEDPFYIRSGAQFQAAVNRGSGYFVMANDITLPDNFTAQNFSGTIYGGGYTVTARGRTSAVFNTLTGTLQNINFDFGTVEIQATANTALVANTNAGTVDGITVTANAVFNVGGSGDIYLSLAAGLNSGTMHNSRITQGSTAAINVPEDFNGRVIAGGIAAQTSFDSTFTANESAASWAVNQPPPDPVPIVSLGGIIGAYVVRGSFVHIPLNTFGNFTIDDRNTVEDNYFQDENDILGIGYVRFVNPTVTIPGFFPQVVMDNFDFNYSDIRSIGFRNTGIIGFSERETAQGGVAHA